MQNDRTVHFWNKFYSEFENQIQKGNPCLSEQQPTTPFHRDKSEDDDEITKRERSCITVPNSISTKTEPAIVSSHNIDSARYTASKEWILHPSVELFDLILMHARLLSMDHTSNNKIKQSSDTHTLREDDSRCPRVYRILEIGCGNSRLAIELWTYILHLQKLLEDAPSDRLTDEGIHDCSRQQIKNGIHLLRRRIQFWSSDVSDVCIKQNQRRDFNILKKSNAVDDEYSASFDSNNQFFQYCVINLTQPHPELENKFDLILDKGCLDTFLFRSKNRGASGQKCYAALIQTVLDNIQSWLKNADDNDVACPKSNDATCIRTRIEPETSIKSCEMTTTTQVQSDLKNDSGGVFIILSPRSKHKSLRDYCGFQTVYREQMDTSKLFIGALEAPRAIDKSSNLRNKATGITNSSKNDGNVFLYCCTKNEQYLNNKSYSYRIPIDNSHLSTSFTTLVNGKLPDDNEKCPSCRITFSDYRKRKCITGRGETYLYRHWTGHCQHCRESTWEP